MGKSQQPKKSCCRDTPRCGRCPIRMLAEGRLEPQQARELFARERNRRELKKVKRAKKAAKKLRKLAVAA